MNITELFSNVDWLATTVGTLVAFLLGGLWFSDKLFGQAWKNGSGGEDKVSLNGLPLVVQAVATLLLALVTGIALTTGGFSFAILVILTVATFIGANGFVGRKSSAAIGVEVGYLLARGSVILLALLVL